MPHPTSCPDCGAPLKDIGVGLLCTGSRCMFYGGKRLDVEAYTKGYGANVGAKARRRLLDLVREARYADNTSAEHLRELALLRADMPFENDSMWRRFFVLMTRAQLQEACDCLSKIAPEQKRRKIGPGLYRVSVSWHDPFTVTDLVWMQGKGKSGAMNLEGGSSYCGHLSWDWEKELLLADSMTAVRSVLDADETLEPVLWRDGNPRALPKGPVTALYESPKDILFISQLVMHHPDLRIAKITDLGLRRERYAYEEVLLAVLRKVLDEAGEEVAIELAGKLVIPESVKVAFPEYPNLTASLGKTERTTEACKLTRKAVHVFGAPITDYGVEVLRAVRVSDDPPSVDVKFIRGKDEETVRLNVVTLASRQKFAAVLNASLLGGRPLSILDARHVDALRHKLHAELIKRPVEQLATSPGPGRGCYHLPGVMVTPTEDLPGRLPPHAFKPMKDFEVEVTGERLHLILLLGALLWRHAAGAKVSRVNIALEHGNLVNEIARWYGQRLREQSEGFDFISAFGKKTVGGLHLHRDGLRLARLTHTVVLRPKDWFVHCVRCGLVGNCGTPDGHPIPASLIEEGASLLKFFDGKFDLPAALQDITLAGSRLTAQSHKASGEDNGRLDGELKVKDATDAADTVGFAPRETHTFTPQPGGNPVNGRLVSLFNDYALALWQANQWRALAIRLHQDAFVLPKTNPAMAAERKFRQCMKKAVTALYKIWRIRREIGEAAYRESVWCVGSVFVEQADADFIPADQMLKSAAGGALPPGTQQEGLRHKQGGH